MKKLLVGWIVLTSVLLGWGCEKAPTPTEAPKIETPAKTADAVKTPVLPHTISEAEVGQKAVCPVMGTKITVGKNTQSAEYKGKIYYFCCADCPVEFKKTPDKYAK